MQAYLINGARIAVLIDPQNRVVYTYRPRTIQRQPGHDMIETSFGQYTTLSLAPELPGLVLDLKSIFIA